MSGGEHATLPLAVPVGAREFAFDFSVTGDPGGAILVFGLNGTRLFTLSANVPAPGVAVVLSWPSTGNDHLVESAGSVTALDWAPLPQAPALFAGSFRVTNAVAAETRFFRLRRQ